LKSDILPYWFTGSGFPEEIKSMLQDSWIQVVQIGSIDISRYKETRRLSITDLCHR